MDSVKEYRHFWAAALAMSLVALMDSPLFGGASALGVGGVTTCLTAYVTNGMVKKVKGNNKEG